MNDKQTTIQEIKDKVKEFRSIRGWTNTDPKDVAISLMLEAGEILENFQWMKSRDLVGNEKWRKAMGEEMADVLFLMSELATQLDVDLSSSFEQKMEKQAKKYPVDLFNPDRDDEEHMKEYFKIKARTRGGHPLADEE